ncbi:Uncharacterised protein [Staphylococcus microti]|uniref:Uncharacterized protein n=1 Tax=Staphylococcus microti TaxID=569857 RepID=A0A380GU86_9STAP|nr:hypothetical protein [Staphylococcus microti]SUM57185.1 Uncharacterised protein [Staphylococcus microti]
MTNMSKTKIKIMSNYVLGLFALTIAAYYVIDSLIALLSSKKS